MTYVMSRECMLHASHQDWRYMVLLSMLYIT